MRRSDGITGNIDWLTVMLFAFIAIFGFLNIYAVTYDSASPTDFDLSSSSGKQFIFMAASVLVVLSILIIDFRFYDTFAYFIYGGLIVVLVGVLIFGNEIAGSKSWIRLGPFGLQPSEMAKAATTLAVAKYISSPSFRMDRLSKQLPLFGIIALPAVLIVLQGDAGTALVYGVFLLVFFREGMSPFLLILGVASAVIFILTLVVYDGILYTSIWVIAAIIIFFIRKSLKKIFIVIGSAVLICGMIYCVDYFVNDVLKPHQQNRIKAFINPEDDPRGSGYNVIQSKIAIGSGGFSGKGFLEGTQTKGGFVPEQRTDFIFCTIGEEHGWIGSAILIILFVTLFLRILYLADRQKWRFARVYGYAAACILFFHFSVNIGMTIGLFPVIGIPLPLFSYGGSSFMGFTILIFILLKLDAHRGQVLVR